MRSYFTHSFLYSPIYQNTEQVIRVQSPATVANMVCGFDILGFAVNDPFDEMQIAFQDKPGVTIINEDDYHLPTKPELNVAGAALLAMLELLDASIGFELRICKKIKP